MLLFDFSQRLTIMGVKLITNEEASRRNPASARGREVEEMARTISIGKDDFADLRRYDSFYIDKTNFISEWWKGRDKVTLITRPRRFGKTLNLNMIDRFFSNLYDDQEKLFGNLAIWQDNTMRALAGQYPVINLSFAKIKNNNFAMTKKRFAKIVSDAYSCHRNLLRSEILLDSEKKKILHAIDIIDPEDTADILSNLCRFLSTHYGKKVIILLDEYDTPMQEAYVHGYWEDLVEFTRNIFNAAFKTNPFLDRALMTGITRVSRESLFSDLNNLKVVTTTSNDYETSFGFTEQEVFDAMDEFGFSNKKEVKYWYDGFIFGRTQGLYNPWSITQFLDEKGKLAPYWTNTSSNSLAGKLIQEGSAELKKDFETLLAGGTITVRIDEEIVYGELDNDDNSIYSLLMATGYLKPVERNDQIYTLALTNHEVRLMFEKLVRNWFKEAKSQYNDFVKALLLGDLEWMNTFINDIALQTFRSFDTGTHPSKTEPERFYHGFVLGLMVELKDRFDLRSNRESGFGRYDILLEPLAPTAEDAIIIEFKVRNPKKEPDLETTVQAALRQIEEKNYAQELIDRGFPADRIRSYGFAFEDLSRRPADTVKPEALEGLMQRFPIDASLPFEKRSIYGWNRLLEGKIVLIGERNEAGGAGRSDA